MLAVFGMITHLSTKWAPLDSSKKTTQGFAESRGGLQVIGAFVDERAKAFGILNFKQGTLEHAIN